MKAIICGGRKFGQPKTPDDQSYLEEINDFAVVMENIHNQRPISVVIQGGARGADELAKFWAKEKNIQCIQVNADWNQYRKQAGWIRNNQMADLKPDVIIAFPGGNGTDMMIKIGKMRNIEVLEV